MAESDAMRPRFARTSRDLLAWFAFLMAGLTLAARYVPVVNHVLLVVAAVSPYLTMLFGLSALLLLANRRRWQAIVALGLFAVAIGIQAPRFIPEGRDGTHRVAVRVLTANLHEGWADPGAFADLARSRADLVMVQELTPELAAGLKSLDADFPYQVLDARRYAAGVGIWSRYPLAQSVKIPEYALGVLTATAQVPGAADDAVVVSAHLSGPWPWPIDDWRREIAELPADLHDIAQAAGRGAVIVGGDFNATPDMRPFRRLLDAGYRDAADQAGAGLNPTYPGDRWMPPLISIDHILTHDSAASDMQTVRIQGSDHLGVTATIHLPG